MFVIDLPTEGEASEDIEDRQKVNRRSMHGDLHMSQQNVVIRYYVWIRGYVIDVYSSKKRSVISM